MKIVRRPEREALLRAAGAAHACTSTAPSFTGDLTESLIAISATLAFDAIGGGRLASQILSDPSSPGCEVDVLRSRL